MSHLPEQGVYDKLPSPAPYCANAIRDSSGRLKDTFPFTQAEAQRFFLPGTALEERLSVSGNGGAFEYTFFIYKDTGEPAAVLVRQKNGAPISVYQISGTMSSKEGGDIVPVPYDMTYDLRGSPPTEQKSNGKIDWDKLQPYVKKGAYTCKSNYRKQFEPFFKEAVNGNRATKPNKRRRIWNHKTP